MPGWPLHDIVKGDYTLLPCIRCLWTKQQRGCTCPAHNAIIPAEVDAVHCPSRSCPYVLKPRRGDVADVHSCSFASVPYHRGRLFPAELAVGGEQPAARSRSYAKSRRRQYIRVVCVGKSVGIACQALFGQYRVNILAGLVLHEFDSHPAKLGAGDDILVIVLEVGRDEAF